MRKAIKQYHENGVEFVNGEFQEFDHVSCSIRTLPYHHFMCRISQCIEALGASDIQEYHLTLFCFDL